MNESLEYSSDWVRLAKDIFRVTLDQDQEDILRAIQNNRRVSVRSGHARGKDFIAALASLCFLYSRYPSKVISTAPTGRQVTSIMMSEVARLHKRPLKPLGGEVLSNKIKLSTFNKTSNKFEDDPDWFLEGFKAQDKATEAWTGFHSPNLMIVVTEASGIEQETFNAIEGLLTGDSKLVILFNPNHNSGEAYQSARSGDYVKFKLSCLNAPNVLAKKILIPGQVDWEWVNEKVIKWCDRISAEEAGKEQFAFEWENESGKFWYRPDDLFLVKVMGEFPREASDQLIPLSWVERSNQLWLDRKAPDLAFKLGADIAGMGRDKTVFCYRIDNYVKPFERFSHSDHMESAGKVKTRLIKAGDTAYVDTIGEGAGVYSRLIEQGVKAVSVKFSEGTTKRDFTEQRQFVNVRAYAHWAIRDALDPKFGVNLALPPDDDLTQELTEIKWKVRSDGRIILEEKDEIKKRLGRSPDSADALALTYYPNESGDWPSSFTVQDREN